MSLILVINSCVLIFHFLLSYILVSGTGQCASLSPESCLPREASKITSLNETIGQEHSEEANLLMASHSSTPSTNIKSIPEMVKREYCDKVALHDSELCLAVG